MASTDDPRDIQRLAELVAERNEWEHEVAAMIGRPALIGNLGEYIAAHIFGIRLHKSGSHKGSDGVFADGPLAGRPVNIKWYARLEYILDLAPGYPDAYLVLAGPDLKGKPTADHSRPWLIESAYLFESERLLRQLKDVKLGIATSIRKALWDEAQLYPEPNSPDYTLTDSQRDLLRLFGAGGSKGVGSR